MSGGNPMNNDNIYNSVFITGVQEKSHVKPLKISSILVILYIVFFSLYIWLSGKYAADMSNSVSYLEHIELVKGVAFVSFTGSIFFVISFLTLRKIEKMDTQIIAQKKALILTEQVSIVGIFASSVCHDINNLMSVIIGNLEVLQNNSALHHKDKEYINNAMTATDRLTLMVTRLLKLGREKTPGTFKEINLSALIKETLDFTSSHKKAKNCRITASVPEKLFIKANSTMISRMLLNLIINAAEATDEKGNIEVKVEDQADKIVIEVHDNGPGIPKEMRESIFNAFFTTKDYGNGLGLLSVKVCADTHKGTVEVADSYLGGTCFRITFPKMK